MILALIYLVKNSSNWILKVLTTGQNEHKKFVYVKLDDIWRASDLLIVTKFSTSRITWFKKLVIKQRFFVAILCQFKTNKITAKSWQEVNTYIGKGARLNSASSAFAEISKIFLSFICPNLM